MACPAWVPRTWDDVLAPVLRHWRAPPGGTLAPRAA
ncbi:MAG: hypothetical protein RL722_890 [Pseudomonadota bacterium]|jgi:hypothetical protein